jgi:hypothetical protein
MRSWRLCTQRVRTDNAFSNAPMLAIYDAFGFEAIGTRASLGGVVGYLVEV